MNVPGRFSRRVAVNGSANRPLLQAPIGCLDGHLIGDSTDELKPHAGFQRKQDVVAPQTIGLHRLIRVRAVVVARIAQRDALARVSLQPQGIHADVPARIGCHPAPALDPGWAPASKVQAADIPAGQEPTYTARRRIYRLTGLAHRVLAADKQADRAPVI